MTMVSVVAVEESGEIGGGGDGGVPAAAGDG
jgi:hypothetical protein